MSKSKEKEIIGILSINLENCYGIGEFNYDFEWEKGNNAIILYAQNGVMKTSLTKVFEDISNEKSSEDRFNKDKIPKRKIKWNNVSIEEDTCEYSNIVTLSTRNIVFRNDKDFLDKNNLISEKNIILLNQLYEDLNKKMENFNNEIGVKKELGIYLRLKDFFQTNEEREYNCFGEKFNDLILTFYLLKENFTKNETYVNTNDLKENFEYKIIKDLEDKSIKILFEDNSFKNFRKKYIEWKRTTDSKFFDNKFTYYKFIKCIKDLDKMDFFSKGHSLYLQTEKENYELKKYKEGVEYIDNYLFKITKDLKEIQEQMDANDKKRSLCEFYLMNPFFLEYESYEEFLINVYVFFLNSHFEKLESLIQYFDTKISQIEELKKIILDERKYWKQVSGDILNTFYNFKYRLHIKENGSISLINLLDEKEQVNSDFISDGEYRIYQFLNFMFQINKAKQEKKKTLVILDDVLDSYDYNNKYNIFSYIKDLNIVENGESDIFKIIILTHNYDFYRLVGNNLSLSGTFSTEKTNEGKIILEDHFNHYRNYFSNIILKNINEEPFFIAAIPFARTLLEMSVAQINCNEDYKKLCRILHYQDGINEISYKDIEEIFSKIFDKTISKKIDLKKFKMKTVYDGIFYILDMLNKETIAKVEKKHYLVYKMLYSMGIRIKIEEYLKEQFGEEKFREFEKNGVHKTRDKYKELKKEKELEEDTKRIVEKCICLCNENIHCNSFMIEPLLDNNINEYIALYNQVKELR